MTIEVTQADRAMATRWSGHENSYLAKKLFAEHRLATRTDATPVATDVAALVEAAKDALPFMTQLRAGICLKTDGKIVSADSAYQNLYAALAPFTKGQNDE